MGSCSEGQTYCLRWNNHKSNLVEILDALIKMESYVDCTIVVDEQVQFKAHRVILAANSPYFQSILQDVPMDHCSILFPGVQAFEMRALLEYMYTGEVNVTQSQIPRIMKIAEQLEVKGLFDMTDLKEKFIKFDDNNGPAASSNHLTSSTSSSYTVPFSPPPPPPPPPIPSSQTLPPSSQTAAGIPSSAILPGGRALTPPDFRDINSKDIHSKDLNERDSHPYFSHSHSQHHQSLQQQHNHRTSSSTSSINLDRNINERRYSSSERLFSGERCRDRESRDRSNSGQRSSSVSISDLHHHHHHHQQQQQQQQQQQSSPVITTSSNIIQHQAQSSSSSPPPPAPSYLYKSPYSSLYTKSPGISESRRSTEERNERYSSLTSDRHDSRHERHERGLHNERSGGNERLHDRHLSSQQLQQQLNSPPPPPPSQPALTQQHPPWPISSVIPSVSIPTTAAAAAMLSSVYENASDMNPLKRKKLSSISSMLMGSSDTPILRNVLAQTHAADSSQPMPLVKQERDMDKQEPLNCSGPSDYNSNKFKKYDKPHSQYLDKSFDSEGSDCASNHRAGSFSSGNNNSQKPEWKRYKQYTRASLDRAINDVREGISALQASRKHGVPSRTLYDKVKKLNITPSRQSNRSSKGNSGNSSSSASFPFGISGTTHRAYTQAEAMLAQIHESNELHSSHLLGNSNGSNSSNGNGNIDKDHYGEHNLPPNLQHRAAAALLDPAFLQQAFESRGGDITGRDALHAMALAAAAHAAVNGMSTSPGTNGTARSPSPGFALKYSRSHHGSPPPSSTTTNLNRTSTSTSSQQQHHHQQSILPLESDRHTPERDRDCSMEYDHNREPNNDADADDDDDGDDDDDDDNSRSPPSHNTKHRDDIELSEQKEHHRELIENVNRNRLDRKCNLIDMRGHHEQDRVEDLSINRKETATKIQQNINSPSPQHPLSPSSSSPPSSSPLHPVATKSPHQTSSHQSNITENNHHKTNSSSYCGGSSSSNNNSTAGSQQQSTGVIMPPIITKLSTNNITETSDYQSAGAAASNNQLETSTASSTKKRELLTDETRD